MDVGVPFAVRTARLAMAGATFATVVSSQACVETLPAPQAPEKSLPTLPAAAEPDRGKPRLIIATDVPARVDFDESGSGKTGDGSLAPLCIRTPCAVTLPPGDYRLKFSGLFDDGRSSSVAFQVQNDTEVLNHRLGQQRGKEGDIIGTVILGAGGAAAVIGGLYFMVDNALQDGTEGSKRQTIQDHAATAGTVALVGLLGMAVGAVVLIANPRVRQPGSATLWSPETARSQ